jgi:DNA-binding transcriptional ArsR family regulator
LAKHIPDKELTAIEDAVGLHGGGVGVREIADALKTQVPLRTLQYRLKHLVDAGRLLKEGEGRWAKYSLSKTEGRTQPAQGAAQTEGEGEVSVPLSPGSAEIRRYLRQPPAARKPAGYNRQFLDSYRPNVSFYLSAAELTQNKSLAGFSSTCHGTQVVLRATPTRCSTPDA